MTFRGLLFASAALAALAAGPAAAGKPPTPGNGKAKLECKLVLGLEAAGMVKYEVDRGKRSFMAAVEVELPPADDEDDPLDDGPNSVPLHAAGDLLPVLISTDNGPYKAGDIKLARDGDGLEGALKLEAKPQRRRDIRPFPLNFPPLTVGTTVTIGGQACTLQDRSQGRNKR